MLFRSPAENGEDTLSHRIESLNEVRLFEDIRNLPGAIDDLAKLMKVQSYAANEAIIKEGDVGDSAFFLIRGAVRVLKSIAGGETFPVALLDAKDHPFFGEAALVASDKRSATIRTDQECMCLILEKSAFDAFCAANPQWALPIVLRIGKVVVERDRKSTRLNSSH